VIKKLGGGDNVCAYRNFQQNKSYKINNISPCYRRNGASLGRGINKCGQPIIGGVHALSLRVRFSLEGTVSVNTSQTSLKKAYLYVSGKEWRRFYWGAGKSLARPTSRCILFDGENISFDASLVLYT
jgi:hypothetical protein